MSRHRTGEASFTVKDAILLKAIVDVHSLALNNTFVACETSVCLSYNVC